MKSEEDSCLSLKASTPMTRLPSQDAVYLAIARSETPKFLREYFGDGWSRRGDPRTVLDVSLEGFRSWVHVHGIPQFVLQEGHWNGHDHLVIAERDGAWLFGFAERGVATLFSTHPTLESARAAAAASLWDSFQIAANPSNTVGGQVSGTPFK